MATHTKISDSAEAALSAIEEALTQSINPSATSEKSESKSADDLGSRSSSPSTRASVKTRAEADLRQPIQDLDRPFPGLAANDDRKAVGEIIQTLQARPSRRPYLFAAIASGAWILSVAVALLIHPDLFGNAFSSAESSAVIPFLVVGIALPVVLFFLLALASVRAAEMRTIANSMTQVALRLAQPEAATTEAVVSLSQVVRREVAAMGDGMERAVARASELEAMVHNEIATLERAYGQNEVRIRALIDELALQRDAISSNAEHIRSSILTTHEHLGREINQAMTRITALVDDAGSKVAGAIDQKTATIAATLGRTGETMIDVISEKSDTLLRNLTQTNDVVSSQLSQIGKNIVDALEEKSEAVTDRLASTGDNLVREIVGRAETMVHAIETASERAKEQVTNDSDMFVSRIADMSESIRSTIEHQPKHSNAVSITA